MTSPLQDSKAPPKDSHDQIRKQQAIMHDVPMLEILLNEVPISVVVLNAKHQIIFSNMVFMAMTERVGTGEYHGKLIGEVFRCSYAEQNGQPCGMAVACESCGVHNALSANQIGYFGYQDASIQLAADVELQSMDLRVWSTEFPHGGEVFKILYLMDVSDAKRRRALEQIFFHDVLNLAGAVMGLSEVLELKAQARKDSDKSPRILHQAAERLVEEIQAQRDLVAAEEGSLMIVPVEIHVLDLFAELVATYITHPVGKGKSISVEGETEELKLVTEPVILGRVLGNMVKNALEASKEGGSVLLGATRAGESVRFWVKNRAMIPLEHQQDLFKRSFSTKGKNRGLGTYSMKMLTETYLQGTIGFSSTEESGTMFYVTLPEKLEARE